MSIRNAIDGEYRIERRDRGWRKYRVVWSETRADEFGPVTVELEKRFAYRSELDDWVHENTHPEGKKAGREAQRRWQPVKTGTVGK